MSYYEYAELDAGDMFEFQDEHFVKQGKVEDEECEGWSIVVLTAKQDQDQLGKQQAFSAHTRVKVLYSPTLLDNTADGMIEEILETNPNELLEASFSELAITDMFTTNEEDRWAKINVDEAVLVRGPLSDYGQIKTFKPSDTVKIIYSIKHGVAWSGTNEEDWDDGIEWTMHGETKVTVEAKNLIDKLAHLNQVFIDNNIIGTIKYNVDGGYESIETVKSLARVAHRSGWHLLRMIDQKMVKIVLTEEYNGYDGLHVLIGDC
jgi:hypothetical protein